MTPRTHIRFRRGVLAVAAAAVATNGLAYWAARTFCRFETGAEGLSLRILRGRTPLARDALARLLDATLTPSDLARGLQRDGT